MDWLSGFFFFWKTWHFSSCSAEGFSSSTCLAGSRNDLADLRWDGVVYDNN